MAARASASELWWDPRALTSLPQGSPSWGDAQRNAASPAAAPSLSFLSYVTRPVAHGHAQNLGIQQEGWRLVPLTLI